MNGSMYSTSNVVDIKLKRGPAGLGFNIVGGLDQQYVLNDSGIYVSKIKEDGAAALDGRLREGDKIVAINGIKLEGLTHNAAVELFRTAGEDVELHVQQKSSSHMNGPSGGSSQPKSDSHVSLGVLVAAVGAAAAVAFLYMRIQPYFRKHF
ncbi:synaptojanin-2-binding protein [Lampris incognitus]|uniref:synaptojanin-2-binding protein n=1 Tax=Lampris incognitus TaxID=2546036 RepID=UPI0024B4E1EB|nr:synaptojanin-2-binding protein [Lampris incognitus]